MSFAFDREVIDATPPPPARPRLLRLLAQIWLRPRRTLEAVADGPAWLWVIPLVLAIAALLARLAVSAPLLVEAQIAQDRAMREASMEGLSGDAFMVPSPEEAQIPAPAPGVVIAPLLIGGLAAIALGWLARTAVLHLGSLALGGRQTFGVLYRVGAWATLPIVLRDVVQIVYMLLSGEMVEGSGLSGLAATSSALSIILGKIDLFTIWYLVLLVLGVQISGQLPPRKAAAVVGFYVLLMLLASLTPLLFGGIRGGV